MVTDRKPAGVEELTQAQIDDLARWWSTDPDDTGEALEAFPYLLKMARRLLGLKSKAIRQSHRDVTDDEVAHVTQLAIDARNALLTPGGSSAPIVRWLMWQEDRGLAVALWLLTRNQRLVKLESAMAYIQVNAGINGGTARLSYRGMLDWAVALGWKGDHGEE